MVNGLRIIELWNGWARDDREAEALLAPDGERISRGRLDSESDRLVARFVEAGLREREVVVLYMPNGLGWMASFIACLKYGLVPLFADAGMADGEVGRIAKAAGARAVWHGGEFSHWNAGKARRFRDRRIAMGKLTSGSTGSPKVLFFRDSEMIADGERTLRAFGFRRQDSILGMVPWGHSYALGSVVVPFLILGCRVCWSASPLPADIEHCFSKHGPSVFPSVPTVIRALARSDCDPASFRSLRVLVTAGSRLDPEVGRAFHEKFGIVPANLYGSSESGSVAFDRTGRASLEGNGVGRAMEGVSIGQGRDGRLLVGSSAVYTYGNRMIDSTGRGVCRTGDYGALDQDGWLRLRARAKGFVKVGEKRIGLADVELRLKALDGVSDALAISLEAPGGPVVAAAIEGSLSRAQASLLMRKRLPSKHRPKVWEVFSELPTNSRGKMDTRKVRAALEAKASESPNHPG